MGVFEYEAFAKVGHAVKSLQYFSRPCHSVKRSLDIYSIFHVGVGVSPTEHRHISSCGQLIPRMKNTCRASLEISSDVR